jgi:hypothetical protein
VAILRGGGAGRRVHAAGRALSPEVEMKAVRIDGTIQPDLSVIDWHEMHASTPRNLRRPTPQTLEGQVALAAALLATCLLYEGDVKVVLKRRLGLSAYACSRLIARARASLYAKALAEQKAALDAAAQGADGNST